MTQLAQQLDLRFKGNALSLSAHRLWEHTTLRQINPFGHITPASAQKPQDYIDLIDMSGSVPTLTGFTLGNLLTGNHAGLAPRDSSLLLQQVERGTVRWWLAIVERHLQHFAQQRAVRNPPAPFLPPDNRSSSLGVPGLHCALVTWLSAHRTEKASAIQWLRRINNLAGKGLRAEEAELSQLVKNLDDETGSAITGDAVLNCLNYDALKLSILPMVHVANSPLPFVRVPANATFKRIKPKLKSALDTRPLWRDRVLGYWIDVVVWDDLLGQERKWIAFSHRGQPIIASDKSSGLCDTQCH